jgi:hypothetical protein
VTRTHTGQGGEAALASLNVLPEGEVRLGFHGQVRLDSSTPHTIYTPCCCVLRLSQELDRPLPTKDRHSAHHARCLQLRTGIGKQRELRTHWQRACKLILAKEDVLTVSRALELALFMDAKLDVSKLGGRI